jgi:DNA-binding transcriptional MerR regulator
MSDEAEYTIGEIAARAGVTTRTIRYYTAEGLLPQPAARGRYAHYGDEHLRRLQQIAELKAAYLPLAVIRERLGAVEGKPARSSPLSLGGVGAAHHAAAPPASLRAGTGGMPGSGGELQVGHYEFFPDLPEPLEAPGDEGGLMAVERWQRVVLAPGVELHVREPLSPARRRRLAALIAAARDQLGDEEGDEAFVAPVRDE